MTTNGFREKLNNGWGKLILVVLVPLALGLIGYGRLGERIDTTKALAADNQIKVAKNCTDVAVQQEKTIKLEKKQDEYSADIKRIISLLATQTAQIENITKGINELKWRERRDYDR